MQAVNANGGSHEARLKGRRLVWMYASDCSGADAPLFAAKSVKTEAAKHNVTFDVISTFVSEDPKNPSAFRFLAQNHAPERSYVDMFERDGIGGYTVEGVKTPFPKVVDVYVAGTECQEISSGNHQHGPIVFSWDAIQTGGVSTRTLLQSIRTIRHLAAHASLRVFILENVKTLNVEKLVQFLRQSVPYFHVTAIRSNALDIQSESDRDRYYVICTRKVCVLMHPAEWPSLIEQCVTPRAARPASDYILRHSSPEVQKELDRKQGRLESADQLGPDGHDSGDDEGEAPPKRRRAAPRSSRAHVYKPDKVFEWQKEHTAIRSALRALEKELNLSLPPARALPVEVHDGVTDWLDLLTPRVRGVAEMFCQMLDIEHAARPADEELQYYFVDLAAPASHMRLVCPNVTPVFMTEHYVGLIAKERGRKARYVRHLLGLEHLLYLGLPRDIDTDDITDFQLRSLAGNSMSVPMMTTLVTLVLGAVEFQAPIGQDMPTIARDFVSHVVQMHPATPVASTTKLPFPGMVEKKRILRTNVVTKHDLGRMSTVAAELPVMRTANTLTNQQYAGRLGLKLVTAHGGQRTLVGLPVAKNRSAARPTELVHSVLTIGVCQVGGPAVLDVMGLRDEDVESIHQLCEALGQCVGDLRHSLADLVEISLEVVKPDSPSYVRQCGGRDIAIVLPLGNCDSEDEDSDAEARQCSLGYWWLREALASDGPQGAQDKTANLGPFLFSLFWHANEGKRNRVSPVELLPAGESLNGRLLSADEAVERRPGQAMLVLGPMARTGDGALLCICKPRAGMKLSGRQKQCLAAAGLRQEAQDSPSPSDVVEGGRRRKQRAVPKRSSSQTTLELVACGHDGANWLPPRAAIPAGGTGQSRKLAYSGPSTSFSSTSVDASLEGCQHDSEPITTRSGSQSEDDELALCLVSAGA